MAKSVRVSSLRHGHPPYKRGETHWRKTRHLPIQITERGEVYDGNDRLYYARKHGHTHIKAVVVPGARVGEVAGSGCFASLLLVPLVAVKVGWNHLRGGFG